MVLLHDRHRWSKSRTTKGMLHALTLSHQVTQHLFRELDIVAKWTGVDHGRAIVFVTGLTKSGNAHQCSRPDGSMKPYMGRVLPRCGVGGTRPGEPRCCRSR